MGDAAAVQLEENVVFRLGGELYGVPVGEVREVVAVPAITPVPRAGSHIEGIINLRGNVVPVVSLHRLLGLPEPESYGGESRVVIVERGGEPVGLLVDGVHAVLRLHVEDMAGGEFSGMREAVSGVARLGDGRLVLCLDLGALLSLAAAAGR